MIELTEALPFANSANETLKGLKIVNVEVLKVPHKFAWVNHKQELYRNKLLHRTITMVTSSAHYIRFLLDNHEELAIGEDVLMKYQKMNECDERHQLKLDLSNGYSLVFQVKLYGFFLLGTKDFLFNSQLYYKKAVETISPLDHQFTYDYFSKVTLIDSKKGSVKQALATEQHIPGLGNGILQDILFHAKMSPKKKLAKITETEKLALYHSVIDKTHEIVRLGGRDTQLDMFGQPGKYQTLMTTSRNVCPVCKEVLIKEAYLGGKVIYCPVCQKE